MELSTAVPQATKSRLFISKCHNQRLIVDMPRPLFDEHNRRIGMTPEKIINFEGNTFIADEESAAKLGMTYEGLVDYLRNHELFGADEFGIYEDSLPETQEPTVEAQTKAIMDALSRDDVDTIEQVIELERDTHNRTAVLVTARAALEQMVASKDG